MTIEQLVKNYRVLDFDLAALHSVLNSTRENKNASSSSSSVFIFEIMYTRNRFHTNCWHNYFLLHQTIFTTK